MAGIVATAAYATIPGGSGVISGCYAKSTGALRVIDIEAGGTCAANKEQLLSWNQQGPAGPAGPIGPAGPTGPAGPQGQAGPAGGLPNAFVAKDQTQPIVPGNNVTTEIVSLALGPGRYLLSAKVALHNRDPQLPFTVTCYLVPSNPDGTTGDPGSANSDFVELTLAPGSQPGNQGHTSHIATQELTQPGTARLSCRGSGNTAGAFTAYATVAAVNVGQITTEIE